MKIKLMKRLWPGARDGHVMLDDGAEELPTVGNPIVQAAYSAAILREDRSTDTR